MSGSDPSQEFEPQNEPEADAEEARPDWLIGAEEGAQAEMEAQGSPAHTPLRLVRPVVEEIGADAPPATKPRPEAWKAAASSVPRLSHVEASEDIQTPPPPPPPAPPQKEPVWAEPDAASPVTPFDLGASGDPDDHGADPLDPSPARSAPAPAAVRPLEEPWWAVGLDLLRTNRALQLGILAALLAIVAWNLWPRSQPTVSISSIREHPERFSGANVTVQGRVGDVYPVGAAHAYYLEQGGDTIVVFSRTRVPHRNDKVRVSGSVSMGYLDGVARPALFENTE